MDLKTPWVLVCLGMKIRYYLYKSGRLSRQDDSLVLLCSNKDKIYIPIKQVDIINVFSQIDFKKNTIGILNEYGITVNFFSYYGNYIGSYNAYRPKQGDILLKQVDHFQSMDKRLVIAKEIIYGSLTNSLSVLKYYHKKHQINEMQIIELKKIIEEIDNGKNDSIEALLIIEAKGKQIYYDCFDNIIRNRKFNFTKRSKNPPENEINAMMSFGYSILYSIIANIIHRSSLNISFPFIHSNARRKEGLQYDIADIFKPVIVDRTIFRMVNKMQINESCFSTFKKGTYLNKEGAKLFIEELEFFLKSTIEVGDNRKMSYQQLLSKEIHKLSNHIKGKQKYKAFIMRW